MQVSIIIVNYKNPPLIVQCVQSILRFEKNVEYEIIVVDNDSQDDTEQQLRAIYPNLKWIQMGYNSGFAKANNAGLKVAEGEFILYLNSDTLFIEPILETMMVAIKEEPKIGLLTCRLLNKDGSIQASNHNSTNFIGRLFRRNPIAIKFLHVSATPSSEIDDVMDKFKISHDATWLSGAVVMQKKEVIQNNSLQWDEDFFMYWEDVELCYRVRACGLVNRYIVSPRIIHLGGASSSPSSYKKFFYAESSKLIFMKKVSLIYHGSHTSVLEDPNAASHFDALFRMQKQGLIYHIGFVKKDMDKTFELHTGQKSFPIILKTDESLIGKTYSKYDGLTIGVMTHDGFRKNLYNMVSAALLHKDAKVHIKNEYLTHYLQNSDRLIKHGYFKNQEDFYKVIGGVTLNLYVTFSECWGQFVNESLALGVPCLCSDVSAVLDFDEDLKELLVVREFDNDYAIYQKSLEVLKNLDYFKTKGPEYVRKVNGIANEKLQEFLNV